MILSHQKAPARAGGGEDEPEPRHSWAARCPGLTAAIWGLPGKGRCLVFSSPSFGAAAFLTGNSVLIVSTCILPDALNTQIVG